MSQQVPVMDSGTHRLKWAGVITPAHFDTKVYTVYSLITLEVAALPVSSVARIR